MDIRYVSGGEELLDIIRDLWQELNNLHLEKSPHFRALYAQNTFEARKNSLLAAAKKGSLLTALAYDGDLPVGYCIASLVEGTGEIESLFVLESYRKNGIAARLMDEALKWLAQLNPTKTVVKVSVGNENAFGFYARYGFLPRLTELQKI
ncbi:MAG TPA: N-acetyltransferase [Ruminococcaceae bacterium]|nr:N-acetyltransferase [Oscillospiraceae bacterium]